MFEKGGRDKCQGKAEGELQQFGREISEGQLRRCIEMKLNGLLEWNTNALTLCQDLRRRTLIHLIDWRVTCWSIAFVECHASLIMWVLQIAQIACTRTCTGGASHDCVKSTFPKVSSMTLKTSWLECYTSANNPISPSCGWWRACLSPGLVELMPSIECHRPLHS